MFRVSLGSRVSKRINNPTLTHLTTKNVQKSATIPKPENKHDKGNGKWRRYDENEAVIKLKTLRGSNIKDVLETYRNFHYEIQRNENIINTLLDFCNSNENTMDIKFIGSIMTIFNRNKQYYKSISLYERYHGSSIIHNDVTNLLYIKACINTHDYDKGNKLIESISDNSDGISIKLITTMIDFYGKFGHIHKSFNYFDKIPSSQINIISINAMMNAYNNNKEYGQAISLYEQYIDIIKPNDVTNLLFLKACINTNNYDKGRNLHNTLLINESNHDKFDIKFITTLIDFYGKNGDIDTAFKIFNNIPSNQRNRVSINCMMSAYNNNGHYNKCIAWYEKYNKLLIHDDVSTLLFLKACININDYHKGKMLIDLHIKKDINKHSIELITTLIDFYGKFGKIERALSIFHNISLNRRNLITIGAMMNVYNNNQEYDKTVSLYDKYNIDDDMLHTLFIKACINIGNYERGKQLVDSLSIKGNIHNRSIEFINTLIDFYGKCGDIENAFSIFTKIPTNKVDIVSITSMMNAYNNNEEYNKTVIFYKQHVDNANCIKADHVSNLLLIEACIHSADDNDYKGEEMINNLMESMDVNSCDIKLINKLIDYYGKIGDIDNAVNLFKDIPSDKMDVAIINTMMNAYNNNEEYHKSISLYEQYKDQHDDITNLLFIKSCTNIGNYDKAKQSIDSWFSAENFEDINNHSIEFITTLIDFYRKIGLIDTVLNIFNKISDSKKDDIAVIGALMNAYNNNEEYQKTINLFNEIKIDKKNEYIYCSALIAAGTLVSPYQGSLIINELTSNNSNILQSLFIQSAMITMYAKCNEFEKAINIFNDNIHNISPETISKNKTGKNGLMYLYSSIMDCYAKMGNVKELLLLFNNLRKDEEINSFLSKHIYSIVLNGCSHSGLIDEALSIFEDTKDKYFENNNIDPQCITALIDCLGRKGRLNEAENLYEKYIENNNNIINFKLKLPALRSLLSSCRIHNDVTRAQQIFDKMENHLIDNMDLVESSDIASMYVMLSNIYGKNKQFGKVDEIRNKMKEKGIKKIPGKSWIELDGKTHFFVAGDKSHSEYDLISAQREKVRLVLKKAGYIFDSSEISRELNNGETAADHLCGHSEKLALFYGLAKTENTERPLTIAKNLRVCPDCHEAFKWISRIYKRKISLRDKNRWHTFENGECSCNDYF